MLLVCCGASDDGANSGATTTVPASPSCTMTATCPVVPPMCASTLKVAASPARSPTEAIPEASVTAEDEPSVAPAGSPSTIANETVRPATGTPPLSSRNVTVPC
jgi:hypothetical protein